MQSGLGHARLPDRGVAIFRQLHLELRKWRHLPSDLGELLLDALSQLVADRQVAPLDLDAHAVPPRRLWQVRVMVVLRAPGTKRLGRKARDQRPRVRA